jgi:hypothetical protein
MIIAEELSMRYTDGARAALEKDRRFPHHMRTPFPRFSLFGIYLTMPADEQLKQPNVIYTNKQLSRLNQTQKCRVAS